MKTIILALLFGLNPQIAQQFNAGLPGKPPLNSCLVSGWPINEGSGIVLHDLSGNANTATAVNSGGNLNWGSNAGFPGSSVGWTDGINAPNAPASNVALTNFDGTTPMAVSVWISGGPFASTATMVGNLNTSGNFQGWELDMRSGKENFFAINSYSGNAIQVTANAAITGGLHYLAATYDGSRNASGVHLYDNGAEVATTTVLNSLTATAASGLVARIAADNDASEGWATPLGYVEIYNCVPSTSFWSTNFALGPGIY